MIGSGIGEFPIGGFPHEDSVSVADPLPGLIEDELLSREFLLRAQPRGPAEIISDLLLGIETDGGLILATDSDSTQTFDVDLSSSGYTSQPDNNPYKLFPDGLARPYNFSVQLPLTGAAILSGGASVAAGEIRVRNPRGTLDGTALYDWLGTDLEVYIGQKTDSLDNFSRFSKGVSAGVTWDLDSFAILHRDFRFRLQSKLCRRYFGTGSCLRFDGSGDWVGYGDILDRGAADSFTIEFLFRSSTTGTVKVICGKKADLTNAAGFVGYFNASNSLIFRIADGTNGAETSIAGVGYLDNGRLRRGSLVCDRVAQRLYLYIDGELISTSSDISTIGSLSNAIALQVGAANSLNSFSGDIDDFRFWSIALTRGQIIENMHREISAQTGLEIYSKYNEGALSTAGDSSGNGRTGTITGTTWVGSLEGDSTLANTVIPRALGIKRQVSPKLVDPQRLVYQLNDGSIEEIIDVLDGGDPYTFGSDVSDIYSSTPAAGTYNTCLAKGLFRLQSSPVGVITCVIRGDNSGSLGYVDTISGIHRKLATDFGGLSSEELNLGTYLSLALQATQTVGFYFDTDINISSALDEVSQKGGHAWWTADRVSNISVGRIDPPESLEVDEEITSIDIVEPKRGGSYRRTPAGIRVGEVVLGYRRYNTKLSADQVSGTVDAATRNDLGEEYRFVRSIDPNRSVDSDTITVYTEIDIESEAQAEADRLLLLRKVDRGVYTLTINRGLLSYFIGTVFNITLNRYDTRFGKKFVVVGLREDMGEAGSKDRLEPVIFG